MVFFLSLEFTKLVFPLGFGPNSFLYLEGFTPIFSRLALGQVSPSKSPPQGGLP